jgi:ATP-dependent HslUV protease ATP-binding subunit HslU
LNALSQQDFVKILTEPENALIVQYVALLKTEDIDVIFEEGTVEEIARIAEEVNNLTEDIGARRLHTIMECLLSDVLFNAPDIPDKKVVINAAYVQDKLKDIRDDEDLSRYIL